MPLRGDPAPVTALLSDERWFEELARRLLLDGPDRDDVLQEARLAALERAPATVADPRSWLAKVAWNIARKRFREERRRRRREHAVARPEGLRASPEASLARQELRRQVLESVRALAEPYRSTLVLRFLEEKSLKEVARLQGLPLNTVKTHVSRALARLRQRLEVRHGDAAFWPALLGPLPPSVTPSVPPAAATASSAAGSLASQACSTPLSGMSLTGMGVLSMSMKTVIVALSVSLVAVVAALGIVLHETRAARSSPAPSSWWSEGGPAPDRAGPALAGAPPGTRTPEAAPAAREPPRSPPAEDFTGPGAPPPALPGEGGDGAGGASAPSPPSPPASAEALRTREALRQLREIFLAEGGREGWKRVGRNMARLQEEVLRSEDGLAELLALLDGEEDDSFLEAVMHHLPMAETEFRSAIVAKEELQEGIWSRFESEESPLRRLAFLRFFAFNRKLSAARMGVFVELSRNEQARAVRHLALDAISSNIDLIPETWEALLHAAEHDPDPECRQMAIQGLAHASSEEAAALVRAAFSSSDEDMRAAALRSVAGERIPEEVSGGDATSYLLRQFQEARTPSYKEALVERLLHRAPDALEETLRQALPRETNWALRRLYNQTLQRIEGR